MNFKEYVVLSEGTQNKSLSRENQTYNAWFGLVGEVGEVVDLFKKSLFQGHEISKENLIKEVGDVAWYIALGVRTFELEQSHNNIFTHNSESNDGVPQLLIRKLIRQMGILNNEFDKLTRFDRYSGFVIPEVMLCYENITIILCEILNIYNIKIEDVLQGNIDKLKKRFPEGFKSKDSINRVD